MGENHSQHPNQWVYLWTSGTNSWRSLYHQVGSHAHHRSSWFLDVAWTAIEEKIQEPEKKKSKSTYYLRSMET